MFAAIELFSARCNLNNSMTSFFAQAAYAVYIIHPWVLAFAMVAVANIAGGSEFYGNPNPSGHNDSELPDVHDVVARDSSGSRCAVGFNLQGIDAAEREAAGVQSGLPGGAGELGRQQHQLWPDRVGPKPTKRHLEHLVVWQQ